MNINGLSVAEMKQLLAKLDNELAIIDNEHNICNNIAKTFSGNSQYATVEYHKKIKADIQIQLDILDFLNNGGNIITSDYKGAPLSSKSLKGARAGQRLYRRFN